MRDSTLLRPFFPKQTSITCCAAVTNSIPHCCMCEGVGATEVDMTHRINVSMSTESITCENGGRSRLNFLPTLRIFSQNASAWAYFLKVELALPNIMSIMLFKRRSPGVTSNSTFQSSMVEKSRSPSSRRSRSSRSSSSSSSSSRRSAGVTSSCSRRTSWTRGLRYSASCRFAVARRSEEPTRDAASTADTSRPSWDSLGSRSPRMASSTAMRCSSVSCSASSLRKASGSRSRISSLTFLNWAAASPRRRSRSPGAGSPPRSASTLSAATSASSGLSISLRADTGGAGEGALADGGAAALSPAPLPRGTPAQMQRAAATTMTTDAAIVRRLPRHTCHATSDA
mmetsp:Transcript_75327/g.203611  ORF Transcript_75327/g.203611 Transcript_75327/m.203611 type:complete len:342 (+) Transcript_75327:158-1183(+)